MSGQPLMLDHLRAAQAEARRFHGTGPVAAWQPRRPRWVPTAAAAVVAALAAVLLARPAAEVAPVAEGRRDVTPAQAHEPMPQQDRVPLAPVGVSAASGEAVSTVPAPAAPLLVYGAAAAAPEAPPSDDDWALHPPPVPPATEAGALRPLFNTPVLPDEAAPLHATELPAEDDTGGGAGDEAQPG